MANKIGNKPPAPMRTAPTVIGGGGIRPMYGIALKDDLSGFRSSIATTKADINAAINNGTLNKTEIAEAKKALKYLDAASKDLGVINIANALPQVVGSATAALVITVSHSYTILFVLAALLASLGAVLIQQIKSVR